MPWTLPMHAMASASVVYMLASVGREPSVWLVLVVVAYFWSLGYDVQQWVTRPEPADTPDPIALDFREGFTVTVKERRPTCPVTR